jgi:predicted AAA+ superfamily ATPase
VDRYLDLLEKVFVIFKVRGFSRNLRKEVSKNSRYYFYDNGVRNSLIQNFNSLSYRNDAGQLWENFLAIERRKTNQRKERSVNSYFWRTYDQKEIDSVEEYGGILHGYEFKWGAGGLKKLVRKQFSEAYPESILETINPENFEKFLD